MRDHPQAGRQPDSPDVAAASKAVWHASNRSPAAPMRDLSLLVIVVSRCSLLCGEHKHAGQHQQCIPRKQPCLGRRTNNGEQLAQRGRPAPPCSSVQPHRPRHPHCVPSHSTSYMNDAPGHQSLHNSQVAQPCTRSIDFYIDVHRFDTYCD